MNPARATRAEASQQDRLEDLSLRGNSLDLDLIGERVAARLAALSPEIMRRFEAPAVQSKWDGSVVTETDLLVNSDLRPFLEGLVPGSYYLGEESADATFGDYETVLAHDLIWAVDEIDGTQNYAAGVPVFGTSIGLLRREADGHRPIMGCISLPGLDQIYFQRGESVMLRRISDGREEIVSPTHRPIDGRSIVCVPDNFFDERRFDTSRCPAVPRIVGCVIADIIFTATGRSAGTVTDFHLWDFAGSIALAQKLGVHMRDAESGALKTAFSAADFVTGNRRKNWCLVDRYVISSKDNFEAVAALLGDSAQR